ncbi:MAG: M23 family metallopeptidase [Deltaproteobacteria bacterium]
MLVAMLLLLAGMTAFAEPPAGARAAPAGPSQDKPAPKHKTATRRSTAAVGHGGRVHAAHATKGPPPPAWTIRPRRHQTPLSRDGYADGDPAPWNARWGCASPAGPSADLAAAIGLGDEDLHRLIIRSGIEAPPEDLGCVPYALLARNDGDVLALAVVAVAAGDALPSLVLFSRDDPQGPFVLRTEPWPGEASGVQLTTMVAADVFARGEAAIDGLAAEVTYEVGGLVRALLADVEPPDPDSTGVRVAIRSDPETGRTRLLGVELIDSASGRPLRQALWVARDDAPGGFFTPNGDSLEAVFWSNPVAFRYISRGVGAARSRRDASAGSSPRAAPTRKTTHPMHIGVDFVAPKGTSAVAVADGTVLFRGYFGGYGNLVIVEHAGGYTSHYGHLSAFAPDLAVGSDVWRGTTLGYVGMTGLATGPHLHFEIRHEGAYVDPLDREQPIVLWSLRRVDYPRLARQVLAIAAAPQPGPPVVVPPPPASASESR